MNKQTRNLAIITAVTFAVSGGGLFVIPRLTQPASFEGCGRYAAAYDNTRSLIAQTPSGHQRDELVTRLADIVQQANDDGKCRETVRHFSSEIAKLITDSTPAPGAMPMASDTPSAAPSSTASPPATPSKTSTSTQQRFLFYENGKRSSGAFGVPITAETTKEATDKFFADLEDAAILATDGELIVYGQDGGTRSNVLHYAGSKSARDEMIGKVRTAIKSTELVTLDAHTADTMYMVDVDGVPVTQHAYGVPRAAGEKFLKVTTADVRVYYFRLLCRWQADRFKTSNVKTVPTKRNPEVVIVPQPTKPRIQRKPVECVNGGSRDEESRCAPPIDVCRQVNDTWQKLYGIKPSSRKPGDLPVDSPKCEKPSDKPSETPKPTPSNPPSDKPSEKPTPKPTPSNPPSEKPSNPPSEKPSETPKPTPSNPPTTVPKDPSKDGGKMSDVNTTRGPGATTKPTQPPATYEPPAPTKQTETQVPKPVETVTSKPIPQTQQPTVDPAPQTNNGTVTGEE